MTAVDLKPLLDQLDPNAREAIKGTAVESSETELRYLVRLAPGSQRRCVEMAARVEGTIGVDITVGRPPRPDAGARSPAPEPEQAPVVVEQVADASEGTRLAAESLPGSAGVDSDAAATEQAPDKPAEAAKQDGRRRHKKVVQLADLRPNPVNGGLFTESLGDESIARMAENQGRHGARHEIETNENDEILDGERRWRGLLRRGETEAEVVVVVGVTSREQIEEYVVDAYDSIRDASIEEQVNLYRLAQRVLARRHGRGRGRPGKMLSNDNVIWSAEKIREEAARVGRFPSYVTAARAAKVLAEAGDELRAAVSTGEISINAAYEQLSKPRRPSKGVASTGTDREPDHGDEGPDASYDEGATAAGEDERDAGGREDDAHNEESDTGAPEPTDRPQDLDQQDNHYTDQEGEPEPGPAEGEEPEAAPDRSPGPTAPEVPAHKIKAQEALVIVVRALSRQGSDVAARVIQRIATEVALDVWVGSDDARQDLAGLTVLVRSRLDALASTDADDAASWLRSHVEDLQELLTAVAPDGDEDDSE